MTRRSRVFGKYASIDDSLIKLAMTKMSKMSKMTISLDRERRYLGIGSDGTGLHVWKRFDVKGATKSDQLEGTFLQTGSFGYFFFLYTFILIERRRRRVAQTINVKFRQCRLQFIRNSELGVPDEESSNYASLFCFVQTGEEEAGGGSREGVS